MNDYLSQPEWLALVADIRAKPDDNLPRLVAADWLDERGVGDATSQFIRLACLTGTKRNVGAMNWLVANWRLLLPQCSGMTMGGGQPLVRNRFGGLWLMLYERSRAVVSLKFDRGFLAVAEWHSMRAFTEHHRAIRSSQPGASHALLRQSLKNLLLRMTTGVAIPTNAVGDDVAARLDGYDRVTPDADFGTVFTFENAKRRRATERAGEALRSAMTDASRAALAGATTFDAPAGVR